MLWRMDTASSTLLLAARSGSEEALEQLLARVGARLLAIIRLRMGSSLRASLESRDILQVVLMKAFARIDQVQAETGGSFMAWLARIAENEIRDQAAHYRRQRRDAARQVPLDQVGSAVLVDRVRSQASQVVLGQQMERLEEALEQLSPEHREVIVLRKLEELSFAEIGERMDRSPDACRMLLARAMTALTLRMRGDG
jgi:RNA polymerase sigma-70 factor (ECF subfamily)